VVIISGEDVTREKADQLRKDFDAHEIKQSEEQVRVWKAIDDLRNRLPNWAVLVISLLMAVCGWMGSSLKG